MSLSVSICKALNKLFPLPVHPFNLQNQGLKTYAEWQYEKGEETIKFYLEKTTVEEMFKDKVVLDIGCGAGGKTLYYASQGAKKVYGIEIVEYYEEEANALAKKKGLEKRIDFRIARDEKGREYFSYINGMTIKKFNKLLKETKYNVSYYREVPLRNFLTPLAKMPILKEGFVKMVVAILEK